MTTVYQINDNGEIKELATYSLSPKKAIKIAYLQFIRKNFNTWDYDKFNVNIKESERGYHVFYGDNSGLFTRTK